MANNLDNALDKAKQDIKDITENLTALQKVAVKTSQDIVNVLGKGGNSQEKFLKLLTKVNAQLTKLDGLNKKIIVSDGQVKVKKNELALTMQGLAKQRDAQAKKEIAYSKQTIKAIQAQKKAIEDKKKAIQVAHQKEIDAIKKSNKERLAEADLIHRNKKLIQTQKKASEAAYDKQVSDIKKANKERLRKADLIYQNKQAILAQKKASDTANQKAINDAKKANKARLSEADAIERNKKALQDQKKASTELSRAYVQLVNAQKKAKNVLQDLIVSQGKNSRETKKAQKEYDRLTSKINQANLASKNFSKKGLGSMARGFKNILFAFGAFSALQMFVNLVKSSVKTVIEFDKQLISVSKTTNIAKKQLDLFGRQAIILGSKLKGISTKNLMKAAEIAGQLGVRGVSNILKFSATIEKLALTSDIIGTDSARSFAKFIELSNDSVENADRLGSVITDLGNNFAATEGEILKNTTEIQRGISIYKTSAHSVIGLGAATSALGAQAEASRGALQKTFKVLNDGASAGVNLEKILKLTGQTAEEFKKEFSKDSVSVFRKFVKGLHESDKSGENLSNTLRGLNLQEKRTEAVVGSLAKNYNILEDALNRANTEYSENIALNTEYDKATESLSSNISDLTDAWDNLVLSVMKGDGEISKFFKNAVQDFTDFVTEINKQNETPLDGLFNAELAGFNKTIDTAKDNYDKFIELIRGQGKDNEVTFIEDLTHNLSKLESQLEEMDKGFVLETGENRIIAIDKQIEERKTSASGENSLGELIVEKRQINANILAEKNISFLRGQIRATKELIIEQKKLNDPINKESESKEEEEARKKAERKAKAERERLRKKIAAEKDFNIEKFRLERNLKLNEEIIINEKNHQEDRLAALKEYGEDLDALNIVIANEDFAVAKKSVKNRAKLLEKAIAESTDRVKDNGKKVNSLQREIFKDNEDNLKDTLQQKQQELENAKNIELSNLSLSGDEREKIEERYQKLSLEAHKKILVKNLESTGLFSQLQIKQFEDMVKKINAELGGIGNDEDIEGVDKLAEKLENLKNIFGTVTDTFSDMFDIDMSKFDMFFDGEKNSIEEWAELSKELIGSVLDASMKRYEIELQEAQRVRDITLNNDLASDKAKENARKKFNEEERRIKTEQAKKERENNLIKIAVDTAVGVVSALGNPLLIAAIIALGLSQAAIVASQPLPQFETGGTMGKDGWAITQEKRPEPIVDKFGNLKTMGSVGGDAITYLNQGDRVFKSQDDFFKEFDVERSVFDMNMSSNGKMLNEKIVDLSLLREVSGLRGDIDKMGRRIEKMASRPINVNNTVEFKEEKPY
tara:strand:+ start:3962 stop:7924 length:3963 start_codon:yes stop_codon:yes gene_type:complete